MIVPTDNLTNTEQVRKHEILKYLSSYLSDQTEDHTNNEDIAHHLLPELQYSDARQTLHNISYNIYLRTSLCTTLNELCNKQKDDVVFYYHPDHLGGAAWITEMNGKPVQYLHYAPYGEMVANQMPYGIDERFKFTGKERDAETGYDNHDARYRWSVSGDWLSVDPLVDKYIDTQPYLYCNGNPIGYIDPNGMGVFPDANALREAGKQVVSDIKYVRRGRTTYCNIGAQAINALAGDCSVVGRANDMGIYLRNPQNATSLTQEEALSYAKQGAVVFASYVSDGSEPGHIAVVAPTEKLIYSNSRKESTVSVYNVGAENGEMTLAMAFGKRNVGLYILNSDIETLSGPTIDGGCLDDVVVIGKSETKRLPIAIEIQTIKAPNVNIDF